MDPFSIIAGLAGSIISRIWPDPTEKEKARLAQFELELKLALSNNELLKGQLDVNKVEAANPKLFVSGWRPFVGWVCASAFAWLYVGQPVLVFLLVASGHPVPSLPTFNTVELMTVLTGMLGMGLYRSLDKREASNSKAK